MNISNKKKALGLVAGLAVLFPLLAFAQVGGPSFDDASSASYGGGNVTLCYQNQTRTVNARQAARLMALGATAGACTPPGSLVLTVTSTGGDATFHFTTTNGNLADFAVTTVGGTGSVTLPLAHGNYVINEKPQAGVTQTSNTCTVTIVSGATANCTVANTLTPRPGSISGTTYVDLNGNGNITAIQKLLNRRGGVTVYIDTNDNGVLDSGEVSQVSDFAGNYKFSNLAPNVTYNIREVVPTGYVATYPPDKAYHEPIVSGQNERYDDFANYLPTRGHHWWDFL